MVNTSRCQKNWNGSAVNTEIVSFTSSSLTKNLFEDSCFLSVKVRFGTASSAASPSSESESTPNATLAAKQQGALKQASHPVGVIVAGAMEAVFTRSGSTATTW